MNNDLITRKSVLKIIADIKRENRDGSDWVLLNKVINGVYEIPTAYGIDMVVEQLKGASQMQYYDKSNTAIVGTVPRVLSLDRAIEIVKGSDND